MKSYFFPSWVLSSLRLGFAARTRALVLAIALALVAPSAHAYFATLDTGEVVPADQYRLTFGPQFLFNNVSGSLALISFDVPMSEGQGLRGTLGFGSGVDFEVGGWYKYVPFPDTASQPAIGVAGGAVIARAANTTATSIRVHPLISKRFATEVGDLIPYASLPIGVTNIAGRETTVPSQLALGCEARFLNWENWGAMLEVGLNLSQAFNYLALVATWNFEQKSLVKRQ